MTRPDHYPLFQDLRRACHPLQAQAMMNIHIETEHHFLEAHVTNHDRLVITFEDAAIQGLRKKRYREGWGVGPFLKRGVSVLAVKPKACDWYAHDDLPEAFVRLRPFLDSFDQVLHYGYSMGGFAALTYADLNRAARVVAVSPQTTYRRIPGYTDPRFPDSTRLKPSARFGDAAEGCKATPDIWLIYDHMEIQDRWHARRLGVPRARHINTPFTAHGVFWFLKALDLMDFPVDLCLHGQADVTRFHQTLRQRREHERYRTFLHHKSWHHPTARRRLLKLYETGQLPRPPVA